MNNTQISLDNLDGLQLRPADVIQDRLILYAEARAKGIENIDPEPYKHTVPVFPAFNPIFQKFENKALISIEHGLNFQGSLLDLATGVTLTEEVFKALKKAEMDCDIECIYLWIDGMGFSVFDSGGFDLANYINNLRKPCYALCAKSALSGFYLLAAAAKNGVYISGDMVRLGSIGVRQRIITNTEAHKIKSFEEEIIGKYKAAGDPNTEMTPEIVAYLESQAKYVSRIFCERIMKYRNMNDEAMKQIADGSIFIGQKAISYGLANAYFSLDKWIAEHEFMPIFAGPEEGEEINEIAK